MTTKLPFEEKPTQDQIHPPKGNFPWVSTLHLGDLLDEMNARAVSYRAGELSFREIIEQVKQDFRLQISESKRKFSSTNAQEGRDNGIYFVEK